MYNGQMLIILHVLIYPLFYFLPIFKGMFFSFTLWFNKTLLLFVFKVTAEEIEKISSIWIKR